MDTRPRGSRLPLVGLLVGVWAMLPPYISMFGRLDVEDRVEIVDHVVPGFAVIGVSLLALRVLRSPRPSPLLLLVSGVVIALAGFWMVCTHVPLISRARQDIVPGGAVAWHGLPGLAAMFLGVAWTIRFWELDSADERPPTR